jgi:hypothetical protein
MILTFALVLNLTGALLAQETATGTAATPQTATATEAATTTTADEGRSSQELRNQFSTLLRERPPEVATILKLDPSLLSDDAFLTKYPELAKFVAAHPEVRHNPRFYLGDFDTYERETVFEQILQGLSVFAVFALIAFALAWVIRTVIEQKRWNRLSRTQNEVHNKILDRFSTSAELLDYIKTPPGAKFLESAPIPLHSDGAPQNAPLTRVMWSVQIGIVVAAGSLGMLLVSSQFDKDSAQGMFALGMIGVSIGLGFIASAVVSVLLSRRLGLWQPPQAAERFGDTSAVR